MKHMTREYKKEDALLRPNKESTLEKKQKERVMRKEKITKAFNKIVKDPF
jgi:hypothetical protein